MTFTDQPARVDQIVQLRDQIIIATAALEQLQVCQEAALVEAIRWGQRLELAWRDHRFEYWLKASKYQDHYRLKSDQFQQQIEQRTQQVEALKAELVKRERQLYRLEQIRTVEQKFQQLLQLSQKTLEDLKGQASQ